MTWKHNLAETKQHYIDWWNHRGIVLNMWEHFQHGVSPHGPYSGENPVVVKQAASNDYGTGSFALPGAPVSTSLNQRWFDPQWRAEFLDWYVGHSCLKADMLPVANTQLGPGSMAAILGSVFEGGEDTIWIHPDPHYSDDFQFDAHHPNFELHKALLKACVERSKGNYYVGMPDLMEGLDVLAAMKGTDKVLMDTLTQPEVLEQQMQRINDAYFRVFDELYDIIRFDGRDCGGELDLEHPGMNIGTADEMAFCYFSLWAPGKMTKLQSDISTMLSESDYRRFVQPYLREQCQRIPYTLYHLDGVGAMRHLPALLEIEELRAIQWTPGVGQPQGGDTQWYDLYRQILAGGKSVMACWVTLDQLRPLLDNIGGEGVHLEMDFHNEDEVEQAMRIVEEYQSNTAAQPQQDTVIRLANVTRPSLTAQPLDRVLVLDGGMGTMVQQYHLDESRYGGHPGCNDYLCISAPDVIQDIHRRYLTAGADIIETNTFSAQRISLADYGLAYKVRAVNLAAARLARQIADAFTLTNPEKPRYVAGSIGPTNKTCSFSSDGNNPLSVQELKCAYSEQIEALIEGGVDLLLIETIFDTLNAKAALDACEEVFISLSRQRGCTVDAVRLPVMLSFSQVNELGINMNGQDVLTFISQMEQKYRIFSVGLNCSSGAMRMAPIVSMLLHHVRCYVSAYPNAGMPNAQGRYVQSGEEFARQCWPMLDAHCVTILGGCCGTTDEHIAALAPLVSPSPGCFVSPFVPDADSSAPIAYKQIRRQMREVALPISANKQPEGEQYPPLVSAIMEGNEDAAVATTRKALDEGADANTLINEQMIRAMSLIGQRFEEGKAFVPQLLMAGRAMKAALSYIKEQQAAMGEGITIKSAGRVVIGTVKGDLHDIGKNLVVSMLEGAGFEVFNTGIDIDADTFVQAVIDHHADILCLSALLTTTMTYMQQIVDAFVAAGIRSQVKIMVGGAPVSEEFAKQIGADAYSANANEAVQVAKRLMQELKQ